MEWKPKKLAQSDGAKAKVALDSRPASPGKIKTRNTGSPKGNQYPRQRGGKQNVKKVVTYFRKTGEKAMQDSYRDGLAKNAGARDAAAELDKQRKEEYEESHPGTVAPPITSVDDTDPEEQKLEYAEERIGALRGRCISFKEQVSPKGDAIKYFLLVLMIVETLGLGYEMFGPSLIFLILQKKLVKMVLTSGAVYLASYMGWSWHVVTAATTTMTAVSLAYSIMFGHGAIAIFVPFSVALIFWSIVVKLALNGVYLHPFFGEVKHVYKIRHVSNRKEDAGVRADAQSLTDSKHKVPSYADVSYHKECRLFGRYLGYALPWVRSGRKKTLNVSLELVLQIMVPRCTGVEYSDEMIANALSAMTKATHSVNICRVEAAFGTYEHSKLLAYAMVKSMHQKVRGVSFPRAPPTRA